MPTAKLAIGIDIGGTFIKAVAMTPAGEEIGRSSLPTPVDRDGLVDTVSQVLSRLESEASLGSAVAVGVSSPGLASPNGERIVWMQGRMEAVQDLNWTEALGRAEPVRVLNDAHAATLGEAWLGAAQGRRDVLLLTLGTGIGGGVLVGGELLRGHIGRAGHLGHLCLDIHGSADICRTPGSLEDAVAECTLRARSGGRFGSTKDLVAAVVDGDAEAAEIWAKSVRALACGIASLINVIDPEIVVLGGGIAAAGRVLFDPLARELDEVEWRPTGSRVSIVPAALGTMAGAIGAARCALGSFMPEADPVGEE